MSCIANRRTATYARKVLNLLLTNAVFDVSPVCAVSHGRPREPVVRVIVVVMACVLYGGVIHVLFHSMWQLRSSINDIFNIYNQNNVWTAVIPVTLAASLLVVGQPIYINWLTQPA